MAGLKYVLNTELKKIYSKEEIKNNLVFDIPSFDTEGVLNGKLPTLHLKHKGTPCPLGWGYYAVVYYEPSKIELYRKPQNGKQL